MELLYLFEKTRNPVLDFFFSGVTHLGDEIALLLIAIVLFWCVNKRSGYFMLVSGFFGILINQTLKLACKIPRPWVKDPDFTIVESAREAATGYSFPSGHTQNAVATFGAINMTSEKKWIKIICIVCATLVGVSRMYLGVHTLWDVIAGVACPIIILLVLENFFMNDKLYDKSMPYIILALTLATVGYFLYAAVFTKKTDDVNVINAAENARTLIGCSLGLIVVYPIDKKFVKFETSSTWYGQIIKVSVGFVVILLLKTYLKPLLASFMGEYERCLRYFLIILFGGLGWPAMFKYIAKIKIPVLDEFGKKVKSLLVKKAEK